MTVCLCFPCWRCCALGAVILFGIECTLHWAGLLLQVLTVFRVRVVASAMVLLLWLGLWSS